MTVCFTATADCDGPACFKASTNRLCEIRLRSTNASFGLSPGKMATTGIELLFSDESISLISSEPFVQSASSGTTSFDLITSSTPGVLIANFRLVLQVRHQSAVKSTITVFPSDRSLASASVENGCHGNNASCGNNRINEMQPIPVATTAP